MVKMHVMRFFSRMMSDFLVGQQLSNQLESIQHISDLRLVVGRKALELFLRN